MRIRKDGRIEPFSHTPGVRMLLPGSCIEVQLFPSRLVAEGRVWALPIEGPVEGFTAQLDLERGCVRVWGLARGGPFRYRLIAGTRGSFQMVVERGELPLVGEEGIDLFSPPQQVERLSLGSHKAQDWDLVVRRCQMAEIFPAWLRLGQLLPSQERGPFPGSLLERCWEGRDLAPFVDLFSAGFSGILTPRCVDEEYRGLPLSPLGEWKGGPLPLLSEGAAAIRSLFLLDQEEGLSLLPRLPNALHAGRLLDAKWRLGRLDMEWSKRRLRRLIVRAECEGEFRIVTGLWKRCRVRTQADARGRLLLASDLVTVGENETLYFDRFEK